MTAVCVDVLYVYPLVQDGFSTYDDAQGQQFFYPLC